MKYFPHIIISLYQIMILSNLKKCFVALLIMGAAVPVQAQRWDNYRPDNRNVKLTVTNLPIVYLDTRKVTGSRQTIDREERISVHMKIIDNGEGQLNYADTTSNPGQKKDYDGWVGLRYRGNSSFTMSDKKPYSFKTLNGTYEAGGKKQKVSLLGMGKDNDWALLAPYSDKSMMRDLLALTLAKPYMEFVPTGRYCEVILDDIYYGVYILSERVTSGKKRLNLDDPGDEGDALTGGYQVEVDRNDEDHVYTSKHYPRRSNGYEITWRDIVFQYKSPEYEDMNSTQLNYLHSRIDAMEDVLAGSNYKDPVNGYASQMDVMSFIDHQLSQEFAHNVDGYRLSTNLYKHRDSVDPRWKTSLWDFNIAFGNADYYDGSATNTWVYLMNDENDNFFWNDDRLQPFWWVRLMTDPAYEQKLKNRWTQYRHENYTNEHIFAMVDSLSNRLTAKGAEGRNSQAWPRWNTYVWPNAYVASSFTNEISHLKQWITNRLTWMDSKLLLADYDGIEEIEAGKAAPFRMIRAGRREWRVIADGYTTLSVTDSSGRQLLALSLDGSMTSLDASALPSGVYVVTVTGPTGKRSRKVVL